MVAIPTGHELFLLQAQPTVAYTMSASARLGLEFACCFGIACELGIYFENVWTEFDHKRTKIKIV